MRPEYDFDFSTSERGKYFDRYTQSTNVVVPDKQTVPPVSKESLPADGATLKAE